ncbi:DNA cytosine methyltransferase [Microbacterium sp. J1-1]|uniref:DNA cytosine methyltransferase n=1 Tax=Microbacterium sp. J1-1 TaxID=2992441 RepID=UPI002114670C|nr:DNA cytosine methyltransferase [Microbacterium sp. J1-1]UUE19372.1 DNA cytosine methyltransferase [Microbacterium sp. J1-1]
MPKPVLPRPRIGSLFSGYGGLDLAVEHLTDGSTVWFSELNENVARVFSHHWPDAPNLGDISTIDWSTVPPIDVLCGGFPCQDVSTVGKQAGLAPGTRSGLWSFMAAAIEALQPEFVVIENVRGLLSAPATRPQTEGEPDAERNPDDATPADATSRGVEPDPWMLGDESARPLRALGAVLGDLADLRYDAEWIGLPASLAGAPHHRFRIFITAHRQGTVPNPARFGLLTRRGEPGHREGETGYGGAVASTHRLRPARTAWLARQAECIGDTVHPDRDHIREWGGYADAIARWENITGRPAPLPALLTADSMPRPAPEFVEWFMGLPLGWVTDPEHDLTANQQITALGNGVLPLHAVAALML